jgi:hypothetical protein
MPPCLLPAHSPEALAARRAELARLLACSEAEAGKIQAANHGNRNISSTAPAVLCERMKYLLYVVGQEQHERLRQVLLRSNGSLLGYKPETLALHFEQLQSVLGVSRQDVIKAVLKAPAVVGV